MTGWRLSLTAMLGAGVLVGGCAYVLPRSTPSAGPTGAAPAPSAQAPAAPPICDRTHRPPDCRA